nr:protein kinase-like domain, concanavalin A-like lectin/glucanase domain protein [Tanacetum cinerariifolium]
MLIELIKDDEYPIDNELNEDDDVREEEFERNHFDKFPTCGELAYHNYLMHDPYLSKIVKDPIIKRGNQSNLKIPCNIGHKMIARLAPRKNPKSPSGLNNFTGITCCLKKPFVELSGMTYDSSLGVVRLTNGNEKIAYKMPNKIEQYDSLSNDEKENMKSVYLRNDKDKKKGVEYVISKILGFYKECLELGPEYRTGQEESSSGTSENHEGAM